MDLRLASNAGSGRILISDQNGNATWQENNYRLKVTGLMQNWGSYGQQCFVMEDTSARCV